jgi:CHASE2 domain-containing sensor protein
MDTLDWLLNPLAWLFARRPDLRDACGRWLLRIGTSFYWWLAAALAVAGAWDQFVHPFNRQFSQDSFDWLMRNRPIAYHPDPGIVVLDIDEASLARLSPKYGRWPWPRELLGEVGARVESAGAHALVFDILFADPDVANPDSEARFDRYVAGSRRSFFPVVRLNPRDDPHSEIALSMLSFAEREPGASERDATRTVAILPPYFKSIEDSARIGTNNIYPDDDNVIRWYPNYERLAGYRIPSLPYRIAELLNWPAPREDRSLLNWPRGTAPYRTVPFASAVAALSTTDTDFFVQFKDKIVLVGATAPSLNDVEATPVDGRHPGIYVLATAIDNTKNDAYLRPLSPAWIWGFELLTLAASAHLFARTKRALEVAKYFFSIPLVLGLISLLSLSVSGILVDLSVPAALVLVYFAIGKLFDTNLRGFIAGNGAYRATAREVAGGRLQVAWLPPAQERQPLLRLIAAPGSQIKLWEPEDTGLGQRWMRQGWVLWRWASPDAGPTEMPLRWVDVEARGDSFALAEAIATAAREPT